MPRLWMAIETSDLSPSSAHEATPIELSSVSVLASLMDQAYQGTIDHEGETLEQCEQEMRATIQGKYGEFITEASNVVTIDGAAVSACLMTMWQGKPLIAFSMTDPKFQRRGLSRFLIELGIQALHRRGEKVLYLVVTDGNTSAQELYRKIGFQELGVALPKTPPPPFPK